MTIEFRGLKVKTDKNDIDNVIKFKNSLTSGEKFFLGCVAISVIGTAIYITTKMLSSEKSENIIEIEKENDYEIR